LIVPCYGTDVRYLAALDKHTGKLLWKKSHEGRNSESTPLVVRHNGADQIVTTTDNRITAHDPEAGKEIWWVKTNWGYALVPRPVAGPGMIYLCGGYFTPTLYAVRLGGKGDVTSTHIAWSSRYGVPNNPSPILVGSELYQVNDIGVATCFDARTGKLLWTQRLGGNFYSSPLFADGRLYFTDTKGLTTVVAPGRKFSRLSANKLEGRTLASLAVAGRAIFLRSDTSLYRIEKVPPRAALYKKEKRDLRQRRKDPKKRGENQVR
jgi:outer membrane protein assembly factor BamB